MCLWVYSRGWTGPGGSGLDGLDGLDGRIPVAVQGDEGMREGTPFFGEGKRSEPLRAADCSCQSQTAAPKWED